VTYDWPEAPIGALYLSAFLREAGWDVSLLDLWDASQPELDHRAVQRLAVATGSRVFLFSAFTSNYPITAACARAIKEAMPDALCVIGGPHVLGWPHDALTEGFDLVALGEGDETLRALSRLAFDRPRWAEIPGVAFHADTGVVIRTPPLQVKPYRYGPLPAYDLLPERYRRNYYARLFTAHGCPYRCVFCSHVLWSGMQPRLKPLDRIRAELDLIRRHVSFEELYLGDESFTVYPDHALRVASLLDEQGVAWGCETRVDLGDPRLLTDLARRGCLEIDFGVESLDPLVLARVNKRITREQVLRTLEATHRAGIRAHVNLMLGLPGETAESAESTQESICGLVRDGLISTVDYFVTVPYPGSPIFETPARFGLTLRSHDWSRYREDDLPVFDLEQLTAEQLLALWRRGLDRLAAAMEDSSVERPGPSVS
jgi:radical SAM superfamily enzyme YgiQ (UPF0313 family)